MKGAGELGAAALVLAGLAAVPFATGSNVVLNFGVVALLLTLTAQGWNLLGGYGGQMSFGHAAFFGTGAYATALGQTALGLNAWLALAAGIAAGAVLAAVLGFVTFRAGLRGSYFALVTLAVAEVMRIGANASPVTGGAAGLLLRLDPSPANLQFESRAAFYGLALAFVATATLLTVAVSRSRFGAQLVAIRENEDAARALGIDPLAAKLKAIALSGAVTAAAGGLYLQYFLYIDANIAYGTWISVDALLAPIVGGVGTVLGPLVGAVALHGLGELTKRLAGDVPGIDLVAFGLVLIAIVAFAPRGIAGVFRARRPHRIPSPRSRGEVESRGA